MHFIWNPLISKKSETGPGNIKLFHSYSLTMIEKPRNFLARRNITECGKIPENIGRLFRRFETLFFEREKRARKVPWNVYGPEKFSGLLRNARQFSDWLVVLMIAVCV